MTIRYCCTFFFILMFHFGFTQNNTKDLTVGLSYGFGKELRNKNYRFSNQFYKVEFHLVLKKTKFFNCEFVLEPELNRADHRLINSYFFSKDDPDYQKKWTYFSNGFSVNHYIVNVGFLARKDVFNGLSFYLLGTAGPMFVNLETERQAKGFCFSHTLALGMSVRFNKIILDIRPGFRHVSNAGLKKPNEGYNTSNVQFGLALLL